MASKAEGSSRSAFVRDFLRKNSMANRKTVEEAWRAAGREGPIQSSLVSNLRREMGLSSSRRGGARPAEGDGAAESPKAKTASKPRNRRRNRNGRASRASSISARERAPGSHGRDKALAEIESDIDRLIFKLTLIGGCERIEDELRRVRRLLYRGHQA
jgi:hypothetical protein